ncbi:cytochrome P450 [Micromonospora endolithica]|uniref:Cytochrome P450 n=1 Tax=Micromonospora endolithica TaxID=230091 RepID=A0A3A9YSK0_9ACTN|nr:cytochrome P450 [Micromonospora endolithica]RKN38236.1 cytochrome P450 [Micromonospora endolithica]TWJ25214.1 cytochrome P450 [Micromonospora endolithica]
MTSAPGKPPIPVMPGGLPGIGHLPRFARDPLSFFTALRERGDIVRWRLGNMDSVFVAHPDDIQSVFLNVEKTFSMDVDSGYAFTLFAGQGIINTHGEFWRRQRKMMQPGMHPRRIAGYADTMVTLTEQMLQGWRPGETRDIRVEMLALTQRIAAKTLFGADVSGDAATVGDALDVASREIGAEFRGVTMFIPPSVPTPGRRRLKAAIGQVEQVLYRIIAERKAATGDRPDDMLSMLIDARDDDGQPMSDKQLRDETMTLYIAGHETTGNTLVWAYQLLARNPHVYERMIQEITEVVGNRPPEMSDYVALRYTEAVVKETLRLYPPAWLFQVKAAADVTLGGHAIARDTNVWMSQWATHRDPRWFDTPDAFRPERFLGDNLATMPTYAWFPFGGGPHVCLGNRFALVEAVLILATIAQRYRLDLDPDLVITPQPLLTLQPGRDVPMRLHRPTAA